MAARHGARDDVRVFGSVARGTASSEDSDLLVDFESGCRLFDLIGLEQEVDEGLGGRQKGRHRGGERPSAPHAREGAARGSERVNERDEEYPRHILEALGRIAAYTLQGRETFMRSTNLVRDAMVRNPKNPSAALRTSSPQVPLAIVWRERGTSSL